MIENTAWFPGENEAWHATGIAPHQWPHPLVIPGSRGHYLLLGLGLVGSLLLMPRS